MHHAHGRDTDLPNSHLPMHGSHNTSNASPASITAMSRRDFSLQLGTPEEYPKCTPMESGYHCNNSDELDHCDCLERRDREQCCFYGRPVEPLAFYLPPYSEINQQSQSPLYGVLPKEIRDLVWEYAFADNGILAPDCDNVFRRKCGSDADVDRCDIVRALLRTCKAVYLETYCLPMQLNGKCRLHWQDLRSSWHFRYHRSSTYT